MNYLLSYGQLHHGHCQETEQLLSKQLSYQLVEICENYEDKNLFKGERIIFSKNWLKIL